MPTKEIQGLFFTRQDEADLSSRLRAAIATVTFIDGEERAPPKVIASLSESSTVLAWICSLSGDAPLDWRAMPPMIQFLRCQERVRSGRAELSVGAMSIAYQDKGVRPFLDAVWKVFRKMCVNHLVAYSLHHHDLGDVVRNMWVAPDALQWHQAGGLLSSNSANLYYTLEA